MLCSPDEGNPELADKYRQSFFHIASRDDQYSHLYHRDLPFLMNISVQMSEFALTLSLGKETCSFVFALPGYNALTLSLNPIQQKKLS